MLGLRLAWVRLGIFSDDGLSVLALGLGSQRMVGGGHSQKGGECNHE